jgi:cell division protein FtsW
MKTDYHRLAEPRLVLLLTVGTLVLLVAVFFFEPRNSAHRWIPLGVASFQPSELAKFTIAVFLAYMIDKKAADINVASIGTVPCLAVTGLIAGLVLIEPDMGTALVLALVTGIVLYVAGLPRRWVLGLAGAGLVLVPALVLGASYRFQRLVSFLHPEENPLGGNFQLIQSKIALGSGGLLGNGLGRGQQKWLFLPEAHTDFIFAVIGEELGLVGTLITLSLFLVIFWRGMRACRRAHDAFGSYLALGITLFLVCQALINMGVASGLLPTKGLPLPFISYGGSSLVVSLGMTGVLLNISQRAG